MEFDALKRAIDARLDSLTDLQGSSLNVQRAMRYAVMGSGRRVRGLLTMLAGRTIRPGSKVALDAACAIEMIHAASLVIDDLPMMDDADLRRGASATHRVYGEDVATLAAFALLSRAFGLVAGSRHLDFTLRARVIGVLAEAVGPTGIIGGQELDLRASTGDASIDLRQLCGQKTGVLFVAAAQTGALIAGAGDEQLNALDAFATAFGSAYQVADDIADRRAPVRSHEANLVHGIGRHKSALLLHSLLEDAEGHLACLGTAAAPLAAFTRTVFADQPDRPTSRAPIGTAVSTSAA
jgi:geranylgeranyl diphosphate synthase type II